MPSSASSLSAEDSPSYITATRLLYVQVVDVAHSTQAPVTNGVAGKVNGEVEA